MISAVKSNVPAATDPKSGDVLKAAEDFESLLIAQLLRVARESSESTESDSVMEMAESQFASVLSASGGLGMARIISKGLEPPTAPLRPTHSPE
jgi:Rod binding domain-containing protein